MNRGSSPNPYGNPYGANSGGGGLFRPTNIRPPFVGGGPPFNSSPFQSPPSCRQFIPRTVYQRPSQFYSPSCGPDGSPFFRSPVSDGANGFVGRSPNNAMPGPGYPSPRCPSPASSPYGSNGNGSFCGPGGPSRGKYARFSNNGRQSWGGTPSSDSGRGCKRRSPGCGDSNSLNSNIQLYYSPRMLSDPWAGLTPVSVSTVSHQRSSMQ